MNEMTFLTIEQCVGKNKLDVFKKRGSDAVLTDFSVLLGAMMFNDYFNSDENERKGAYWTKNDDGNSLVSVIYPSENTDSFKIYERIAGARPVMPFRSFADIPSNGESIKMAKDGFFEVEYGHYPQIAVSSNMQEILEEAYDNEKLHQTGNCYVVDSVKYDAYGVPYKPRELLEYEFKGKRYVRAIANYDMDGKTILSNGESYVEKENVWVEVLPVKWIIDERNQIMITDKVIFSGIQYEPPNFLYSNFENSHIKKYLNEVFAKNLVQSRNIIKPIVKLKAKRNNTYNFDFSEVSETDIIRGALESNVALFLHGKPGCGKSDRVKQLDPDFIELNLSHLDPELLDGLSGEKDGKAVHIKPPWLEELEEKCQKEADKIHILFLEELTNASPMMQAKAYGIALDKKVAGRWSLPENARVVATGNELEDSILANEMAEPLYDRFAHINIKTNANKWLEWAVTPEKFYEKIDYNKDKKPKHKIHPAIYAYISFKGEEVLRTSYDKEHPEPHADPRRWKMASDMLYASNKPGTLRAIIGEGLTRDFIYFCKMPTITIEDVLNGNYTDEEIKKMDLGKKMATVSGLLFVNSENMPKIREFTKKLGAEICKKFEVQWTHGNEERLEQLQEIILQEKEAEEKKLNEENDILM